MASALIDTNLALLLIIGTTNREYIKTHKRTKQFTDQDYDLLISSLTGFDSIWITSHCLAEVSNLLKQTYKTQAEELLSSMSIIVGKFKESSFSKNNIFSSTNYLRLGVADTGFVQKSKRVNCSFTVDFDLYQTVSTLGRKVINLNHLRANHLYP
jgi:short subunit dehydrogenase-like uncharacterized protein